MTEEGGGGGGSRDHLLWDKKDFKGSKKGKIVNYPEDNKPFLFLVLEI